MSTCSCSTAQTISANGNTNGVWGSGHGGQYPIMSGYVNKGQRVMWQPSYFTANHAPLYSSPSSHTHVAKQNSVDDGWTGPKIVEITDEEERELMRTDKQSIHNTAECAWKEDIWEDRSVGDVSAVSTTDLIDLTNDKPPPTLSDRKLAENQVKPDDLIRKSKLFKTETGTAWTSNLLDKEVEDQRTKEPLRETLPTLSSPVVATWRSTDITVNTAEEKSARGHAGKEPIQPEVSTSGPRKRGRPRKSVSQKKQQPESTEKRKRGRPAKSEYCQRRMESLELFDHQTPDDTETRENVVHVDIPEPKRSRGRPRKDPSELKEGPTTSGRGRGRPKKEDSQLKHPRHPPGMSDRKQGRPKKSCNLDVSRSSLNISGLNFESSWIKAQDGEESPDKKAKGTMIETITEIDARRSSSTVDSKWPYVSPSATHKQNEMLEDPASRTVSAQTGDPQSHTLANQNAKRRATIGSLMVWTDPTTPMAIPKRGRPRKVLTNEPIYSTSASLQSDLSRYIKSEDRVNAREPQENNSHATLLSKGTGLSTRGNSKELRRESAETEKDHDESTVKKRGRGRPKKEIKHSESPIHQTQEKEEKRGRGRPRKSTEAESKEKEKEGEKTVNRTRGRPRKYPLPSEVAEFEAKVEEAERQRREGENRQPPLPTYTADKKTSTEPLPPKKGRGRPRKRLPQNKSKGGGGGRGRRWVSPVSSILWSSILNSKRSSTPQNVPHKKTRGNTLENAYILKRLGI